MAPFPPFDEAGEPGALAPGVLDPLPFEAAAVSPDPPSSLGPSSLGALARLVEEPLRDSLSEPSLLVDEDDEELGGPPPLPFPFLGEEGEGAGPSGGDM